MKSVELSITGRKVNGVGYRPFLLLKALEWGIQKIHAFNSLAEGKEIVVVRVQGEDEIVTKYIDFIKSKYPDHAEVEEIVEKEFNGPVDDAFKFAQILQFEQIAKAVPVIISIDKKQDIMIGKQDVMIGKQDVMIEKQDQMLGKQDALLDEAKDMNRKFDRVLENDIVELKNDMAEIKAALREKGII
jgi:acylphosphatase